MAISDCFISIVAPLHNDAVIIESFVAEVIPVLEDHYTNFELVLIDDGSEDDTVDRITKLLAKYRCVRLIRLSRRFGEEIAITAGLDSAIGDYVVIMIPNTDPPQIIPSAVAQAREGTDVLVGVQNPPPRESILRRAGSSLFRWYCRRYLNIRLCKNASQFWVLNRKVVNAVTRIKDRYRYLRVMSADVGYQSGSFVYPPLNRTGHFRQKRLLEAITTGMNVIMKGSRHPLRFASWLGIIAGTLNLLYACYVLFSHFFGDDIEPGWASLSLQTAGMFFFVFLILIILSEYVGHILLETGQRPLYHVLEERNSAVMIPDVERKNVVREATENSET